MQITLSPSKQDRKIFNNVYDREVDWRLLSYCMTLVYNWSIPNRQAVSNIIRVKAFESDTDENTDLVGYFYFGKTIYINVDNCPTYKLFVGTIFHEFCHWYQYWIIGRSHIHMVSERPVDKWNVKQCEGEAENWEKIGLKAIRIYNELEECKKLAQSK